MHREHHRYGRGIAPVAGDVGALRGRTLVPDDAAWQNLHALVVDAVERGVPGAVVECGVARGGSAGLLASIAVPAGRDLWLFDSFQGLPQPGPEDGPRAAGMAGQCAGSIDDLWSSLGLVGVGRDCKLVHVRAGWFAHTFQRECPDRVALLHVDADWYGPTLLCLRQFWNRVSPGGYIVCDDYGWWAGAARAWEEWAGNVEWAQPRRVGVSQAWCRVP